MSIFNLKTSVDELKSMNQGTSNMIYQQITATRGIDDNSFSSGVINYRWQTSSDTWWVPNRSYLRLRCRLSKAGVAPNKGDPLTLSDGIAPNMNLMPNLFQNCEFKLGDNKVISRVADYVPQVDALQNRITKSRAWLDGIGNSTNLWQPNQSDRMNEVSSDGSSSLGRDAKTEKLAMGYVALNTIEIDAGGVVTFSVGAGGPAGNPDAQTVWRTGDVLELEGNKYLVKETTNATTIQLDDGFAYNAVAATTDSFTRIRKEDSRQLTEFELTWVPECLSIFKINHAIPGGGMCELSLNPQVASVIQKQAIESISGTNKVPGTDYDFEITDMYLFVATLKGPRFSEGSFLLDLEQIRCQTAQLETGAFGQKPYDVSPSTKALTLAIQDSRIYDDTSISASKFKAYNGTTSIDLNINRFFIQYGSVQKPQPDADVNFDVNVDRTVQRYTDTALQSGAYWDTGSFEDIEQHHDRGNFYYFAWPRKQYHCVEEQTLISVC